jgi:hypothetical protein
VKALAGFEGINSIRVGEEERFCVAIPARKEGDWRSRAIIFAPRRVIAGRASKEQVLTAGEEELLS